MAPSSKHSYEFREIQIRHFVPNNWNDLIAWNHKISGNVRINRKSYALFVCVCVCLCGRARKWRLLLLRCSSFPQQQKSSSKVINDFCRLILLYYPFIWTCIVHWTFTVYILYVLCIPCAVSNHTSDNKTIIFFQFLFCSKLPFLVHNISRNETQNNVPGNIKSLRLLVKYCVFTIFFLHFHFSLPLFALQMSLR